MKETERISKLFADLYDGSPWLGVNFIETLEKIPARKAAKRIEEGRNTIWEIINHVIQWRLHVLRRAQGENIASPEHNYILPVEDTSDAAWQRTLNELSGSQQKWLDFLEGFDENRLSAKYQPNGTTYYEYFHGILQHDAYHLGQIVLLTKLI